jgi:hypothetical protein
LLFGLAAAAVIATARICAFGDKGFCGIIYQNNSL